MRPWRSFLSRYRCQPGSEEKDAVSDDDVESYQFPSHQLEVARTTMIRPLDAKVQHLANQIQHLKNGGSVLRKMGFSI
jgi:hypothetical protein